MLDQMSLEINPKIFEAARGRLAARGVEVDDLVKALGRLRVELPSWGMARGGTRFGRYVEGAEAETFEEKAADCALVHELTGATPSIATHFPWDGADRDGAARTLEAIRAHGLEPGAVNSNTFSIQPGTELDARMRFGSVTNPFADVRKAAVRHQIDCLEIMRLFGSKQLSVWLADGTNSPGQMSLFEQAERLEDSLAEIYAATREDERVFIEYKFFEPGFYSTAIPDWATARGLAERLGPRAVVLVDLGHHPQATNIEQVVAQLIRAGKFGGFHFNDRKYGDDDLATGSIDPAQLFRIFATLVEADRRGLQKFDEVSLVIDQSHNVKNPVEEMIESVAAIQRGYAQALAIDWEALDEARAEADAVRADQVLRNAFFSPIAEALIWRSRRVKGLPEDPLAVLRASGAVERRRAERRARTVDEGAATGTLGG